MPRFAERLRNLRRTLEAENLEAIIVTQPENRRYLSGFTGTDGVLLVTRPGFSILIGLPLVVVAAISTYLIMPWLLFTLSLIAVVCNKVVKHLLIPHREQVAEAEKEIEGEPLDEDDSV